MDTCEMKNKNKTDNFLIFPQLSSIVCALQKNKMLWSLFPYGQCNMVCYFCNYIIRQKVNITPL